MKNQLSKTMTKIQNYYFRKLLLRFTLQFDAKLCDSFKRGTQIVKEDLTHYALLDEFTEEVTVAF